MTLTIVGLGPGPADRLTIEARRALDSDAELWADHLDHPVLGDLARERAIRTPADPVGGSTADFLADLLARAGRTNVTYAVTGHPVVDHPAMVTLGRQARQAELTVTIVPGLSLIDFAVERLGLDPFAHQLQTGDPRQVTPDPGRPLLLRGVTDPAHAATVKRALRDLYPATTPVTLIADTTERTVELDRLDREPDLAEVRLAFVPALPEGQDVRTFAATRRIIARLRGPNGCPWDLEQTAESLKQYVIEEAYEVVDAIDRGDPALIAEELGDLLLQVVLQAQVAQDNGLFTVSDAIESINTKLVRRHPHVFGDLQVQDAAEVLANWDKLKDRERAPGAPLLKDLPGHLPALAYGQGMQRRLARLGLPLDWDEAAVRSLIERVGTPAGFLDRAERSRLIGLILWRLAALASRHEIDLEDALRTLNHRLVAAYQTAAARAGGDRDRAADLARPAWQRLIAPE